MSDENVVVILDLSSACESADAYALMSIKDRIKCLADAIINSANASKKKCPSANSITIVLREKSLNHATEVTSDDYINAISQDEINQIARDLKQKLPANVFVMWPLVMVNQISAADGQYQKKVQAIRADLLFDKDHNRTLRGKRLLNYQTWVDQVTKLTGVVPKNYAFISDVCLCVNRDSHKLVYKATPDINAKEAFDDIKVRVNEGYERVYRTGGEASHGARICEIVGRNGQSLVAMLEICAEHLMAVGLAHAVSHKKRIIDLQIVLSATISIHHNSIIAGNIIHADLTKNELMLVEGAAKAVSVYLVDPVQLNSLSRAISSRALKELSPVIIPKRKTPTYLRVLENKGGDALGEVWLPGQLGLVPQLQQLTSGAGAGAEARQPQQKKVRTAIEPQSLDMNSPYAALIKRDIGFEQQLKLLREEMASCFDKLNSASKQAYLKSWYDKLSEGFKVSSLFCRKILAFIRVEVDLEHQQQLCDLTNELIRDKFLIVFNEQYEKVVEYMNDHKRFLTLSDDKEGYQITVNKLHDLYLDYTSFFCRFYVNAAELLLKVDEKVRSNYLNQLVPFRTLFQHIQPFKAALVQYKRIDELNKYLRVGISLLDKYISTRGVDTYLRLLGCLKMCEKFIDEMTLHQRQCVKSHLENLIRLTSKAIHPSVKAELLLVLTDNPKADFQRLSIINQSCLTVLKNILLLGASVIEHLAPDVVERLACLRLEKVELSDTVNRSTQIITSKNLLSNTFSAFIKNRSVSDYFLLEERCLDFYKIFSSEIEIIKKYDKHFCVNSLLVILNIGMLMVGKMLKDFRENPMPSDLSGKRIRYYSILFANTLKLFHSLNIAQEWQQHGLECDRVNMIVAKVNRLLDDILSYEPLMKLLHASGINMEDIIKLPMAAPAQKAICLLPEFRVLRAVSHLDPARTEILSSWPKVPWLAKSDCSADDIPTLGKHGRS